MIDMTPGHRRNSTSQQHIISTERALLSPDREISNTRGAYRQWLGEVLAKKERARFSYLPHKVGKHKKEELW